MNLPVCLLVSGMVAANFIGISPCAAQNAKKNALPTRITEVLSDKKSITLIAVLDEHLDLAVRLQREASTSDPALVPLAPRLVVGQGADASNYTFVRVLNQYGIAEASFLSFDAKVRGGVQVAAGRDKNGASIIVATPINAPQTREIRFFNRLGGLVGSVTPSLRLPAPYALACGDFLPQERGDELAVTANAPSGDATILIFDLAGTLRKTLKIPSTSGDTVSLAALPRTGGAHLALYFQNRKQLCEISPLSGTIKTRILPLGGGQSVYPTAFSSTNFIATGQEPLLSTLERIGVGNREVTKLDAGTLENQFWINAKQHGIEEEGRYVKNASYAHRRVEFMSPAINNPALARSENPQDWKKLSDAGRTHSTLKEPLDKRARLLWEPTFTHRMPGTSFKAWESVKDEVTGLPKYLALTRKNNPVSYGEFTTTFATSTYAFGVPELDRMYLLPLRGYLDTLSKLHRDHPERVISVEPNHEHEIAVEKDETIGDYNPAMIRGYNEYLRRMFGLDEAGLKARFGLPVDQAFDAPRNEERGEWDAYSDANPFFVNWASYNRYVVNRRVADTFTQALLAGFAPEIIKSHQIPDIFALPSTGSFSKVRHRITPIDYAMSAGVGLGYTRYGVWFNQKNQIQKAAQTSGFDNVVLGEYQALTPDQKGASDQLQYLFNNGVNGVHGMVWPGQSGREKFNPTMAQAIRDLVASDRPRPGTTGGVGQVVPFQDGARKFDIAAIGTGTQNTGLLKSLKADGSWEGSVYAVPFRTAIAVETLKPQWNKLPNGSQRLSIGPLNKLEGGQQLEVTMRARCDKGSVLKFAVRRADASGNPGEALPDLGYSLPVEVGSKNVRLIVRSQLPDDGVFLTLDIPASGLTLEAVQALRQNERIAHLHRGVMNGERHRGSVTFAVL